MPYIDYLVNKKYIVENVCINRFDESVMCSGICYLEAEIEKNAVFSSISTPSDQSSSKQKMIEEIAKQIYTFPQPIAFEWGKSVFVKHSDNFSYQFLWRDIILCLAVPPPQYSA